MISRFDPDICDGILTDTGDTRREPDMGQESFDELFHADADRFIMLPKYVLLDKRLKGQHRDLYCMLMTYAWHKNTCFPSVGRLSAQLGCADKTIRINLNKLIECGLIERRQRKNKTSIYTIKRCEEVYVESVNPWKLKDWYLEQLIETVPQVDDGESMEVVSEDSEEESRVLAAQEKKRKSRTAKMTGAVLDIDERAGIAKQKAKKRKSFKKKQIDSSALQSEEFEPEHPSKKELNSRDVEAVWRSVAAEVYGKGSGVDAKWGAEQYGIAKRLIVSYGVDTVIRCAEYVIRNWDEYRERYKVRPGPPNMKSIAYWAEMWFPEIEMGQKIDPISNRKKHLRQGEFKDDGNKDALTFF